IKLCNGVDIHLIVVEFSADFDGVSSDHFGKIVQPLKSVAHLLQLICVGANREAVESDTFDSFGLWRQRHNSRSSLTHLETLGSQTDADSPNRFSKVIRVPQVAEVKFIHGRCTDGSCVAQAEQL